MHNSIPERLRRFALSLYAPLLETWHHGDGLKAFFDETPV
jgi:hypothetical protein